MSLTPQVASQQQSHAQPSATSESWRGILIGLLPLFLLSVLIAITIILTDVVRQTFIASGFFVWQRASLITLIAGFGLGLLVYVISLVLILRQAATWQRTKLVLRSTATLWILLITACLVLLPVVLALVLPQTPAP